MEVQKLFVVLGLDTERKPHAARFSGLEEAVVQKAAEAKGFSIGIPKTKEAIELAAKLPEGKIFDSGAGLVPFVAKDLFDKLVKQLDLVPHQKAPSGPQPAGGAKSLITDPWEAIRAGSLVLCRDNEPGPERSWWPATVTEVVAKDTLVVRWKDYPTLKPFRVKRSAVAVIRK